MDAILQRYVTYQNIKRGLNNKVIGDHNLKPLQKIYVYIYVSFKYIDDISANLMTFCFQYEIIRF